jgi:hypothetical protein
VSTPQESDLPKRPVHYAAPSWSWASVVGSIITRRWDEELDSTIEVVNVRVNLVQPDNPFGQIISATLRLKGITRIVNRPKTPKAISRPVLRGRHAASFRVIYDDTGTRSWPMIGPDSVVFLELSRHEPINALVLERTEIDHQYRRVGIAAIFDDALFKNCSQELVEIVQEHSAKLRFQSSSRMEHKHR